MNRPRILVARAIPEKVLHFLQQHAEVRDNQQHDVSWDQETLIAQLQGMDGLLATGTQRIDAALLAACPQLKVVANMTVGFNNLDVQALSAAGVQGTNAPDVLTETTADFGFALLMATARRITESEHYLRAGLWRQWRYDMFVGAEVHSSTLGIIGMGRIGQAIARRAALGFGMRVLYHNRSRLAPQVHPDLLACRNVVLTPHIASATVATRHAMAQLAADNLLAVLGGKAPLTPVNTPDPAARAQRWSLA